MSPKHEIIVADYQGFAVSFTDDGWFDATAAASRHGKEPAQWMRLPGTVSYLRALERKYGNFTYSKSKRGAGGGTWLHPKLAVRFAQWLDDDFAVWCDEQIDGLLRGTHPAHDWRRQRHATASLNKVMNQTLVETRLADGKASAPHHFMTEAKVVNFAICGEFHGLNRNKMSFEELDLLARLEIRNTVMLARGMKYDERKSALVACAEAWRADHIKILEA